MKTNTSKIRKILERILIFLIGLPAVVGLVLFLTHKTNLALNIVVIIFSGIGAIEFASMLEKKFIKISNIESFIFGILPPLAITLNISFCFPEWVTIAIIMTGAGWALLSGVFTSAQNMNNALNKVITRFSVLVYPGFFMYWLIKMNIWKNEYIILLFLIIIFACDSFAWLFGNIFGKNNKGLIPASPNKSIAGYIGGILGAIGVAVAYVFLFSSKLFLEPSEVLFPVILIGFVTGIAASLGDLAESAIKRSSDFKDSGKLMLGRGGVLDSIDSIAAAAPVFYILYYHLIINIK